MIRPVGSTRKHSARERVEAVSKCGASTVLRSMILPIRTARGMCGTTNENRRRISSSAKPSGSLRATISVEQAVGDFSRLANKPSIMPCGNSHSLPKRDRQNSSRVMQSGTMLRGSSTAKNNTVGLEALHIAFAVKGPEHNVDNPVAYTLMRRRPSFSSLGVLELLPEDVSVILFFIGPDGRQTRLTRLPRRDLSPAADHKCLSSPRRVRPPGA